MGNDFIEKGTCNCLLQLFGLPDTQLKYHCKFKMEVDEGDESINRVCIHKEGNNIGIFCKNVYRNLSKFYIKGRA